MNDDTYQGFRGYVRAAIGATQVEFEQSYREYDTYFEKEARDVVMMKGMS